jgi:hypothetical protein
VKASNIAVSQEGNNSAYSKRIPRNLDLLILFYSGSGFVQQNSSLFTHTNDGSKAGGVCVKDSSPFTEETSRSTRLFKFAYKKKKTPWP